MIETRAYQTATLLSGGQVLVAGGERMSADLYDPRRKSWAATGEMDWVRQSHTATLLPNGKVLVTGGSSGAGALASAELYDPATGTWTATGGLAEARNYHTATLLPDGIVLVAGGLNSVHSPLASAELYDPASGSWTATGEMDRARAFHTATLLPDGGVLVAGGFGAQGGSAGGDLILASAELYDPRSGSWTVTGRMEGIRHAHTATLLPEGKVLVAGGSSTSGAGVGLQAVVTAELYDPSSGSWTATGDMTGSRFNHTVTPLPHGQVLVAGGNGGGGSLNPLATTEVWDPVSGSWTTAASMATGRAYHTATLLSDGKVLVAGGGYSSTGDTLASAELYDPSSGN